MCSKKGRGVCSIKGREVFFQKREGGVCSKVGGRCVFLKMEDVCVQKKRREVCF